MRRYDHISEFGGKPVVFYETGLELDTAKNNYRIAWSWEDEGAEFNDLFAEFLSLDGVEQLTGLLTGAYCEEMFEEDMSGVVETVVSAAEQLPSLTDLFIGDIISEENEISWILNTDLSPILAAYPRLRTFGTRGGHSLSLGEIVHDQLQSLTVETGGLGREVVMQVVSARLPELQHLEIWTGDPEYGADSSIEQILPLFQECPFPKLKHLGIANCDYASQVLKVSLDSPTLQQIDVFDLSMGTLTDDDVDLMLSNADRFAGLKKLHLDENMMSADVAGRLSTLPCEVTVGDQREGYTDHEGNVRRYPAVGE